MANGGRINFQVGFNVDKSGLNQLKSSLQELQKIKVGDFKGSAKEFAQMKIAAKEVQQALQKAFNVKLGSLNVQEFNKQLGLSTAKVNEIYTLFSKAGAQGQVAFSRMSSQILTTNVQLKQTSSLITKMGETMINTAKWTVASSVIQGFTNSIRQAFQYVQALDASLTDIRIVTGDSTEQMRQFAQQANSAAQALGRSTMDYTKAALTFYQQGLDDESVAARTQATLQAQNITGSGEQMANYLTAVWNGYKVANEQAQLYVDKLAAVADSSASNMAQLATAMSKVAATANAMGVDVDQLNAQIATIIATTRQAPQTVGNALKTIFARINDIQAGTQDAEVSLGHYTGTMAELGINVLDASGHLRDTGQVMEEIGGKWATMSREQQIYLARTMAGQRQYNNLIALFDNWGKYSDLVNVSMESQGTLVEKNSRYMDSLGAKMQQLGAAGEKVKDALINEQDMKGLVGAGANIVNVFGSFIQSIGGARGAILGFGSIITQVFSGIIAKEINNAVINFQNLRNNAQILKQDLASTEMLGKSMGFQQGTIKQMVEAKQAVQQYYSVMDQGQINAYNGMIKQIGAAKQQVLLLNQQKAAAEKFAQSFAYSHKTMVADSETTIEVLGEVQNKIKISNEKFQELWGKLSQQGNRPQALAQLVEQFNKVTAAVGKPIQSLDSFDRFWEQLKKIKDTANPTAQELDKVKGAYNSLIRQVLQQIGDASSLNQIRKKSEQAEAGLKKAKTAAQDFVNGQAQLFNIQSTIQYISALGRVASSISNIVNITKIWKNESLSTGQKVLQTFTNLGFAIPMLISSLSKLKTVQAFVASLKAKADIGEISRNEKKILQQRQLILLQQIRGAAMSGGIATNAVKELEEVQLRLKQISSASFLEQLKQQFSGVIKLVQNLASKLTGLKLGAVQSFGAIAGIIAPIAISIGAVVIAIRSFYNQWNSASIAAQKAAKRAQEAKKRYNEIKQAFQELKSSFEQYDNTQDALRHLTRGTQEWRDALIQANNVVLELLNNYPLLASYIQTGQNGELSITEQGRRELINTQQRQVNAAMINSSIAARDQREASLRVDAAQLGRTFAVVAQSGLIDYSGSPELVESIARQYASGVIDRQAIAQAVADEVGYAFDTPQRAFETALRVTNTLLEENSQALSSLGHQLLASDRVMESGYNAMAQSLLSQETAYQRFTRQQQSMINGLGGQLISSEYERILQSLNNQGVNQFTQSSSLQDLLNRYMQATGQQGLSWDKNQVTEKNGEYIFHLRDANNQQVNLSQGDFYDIIAATQAQQSIRDFAFEAVESVSQGLGEGRLGEALRNWLAGQDFGNLTQNEIQLVSGFFDSLDKDVRKNLASLRGMTEEQARQSIEALQNSTIESLNQARDKLSPHLSHIFDWMLETITQDLSIQQQKNLAEQLQNIYDTFGETGVSNLQDFYNSVNDFDAFEQLYQDFDPLTDSTEAFIATLEEEGITTGLTTDALNALIDARREELGLLDPQGAYNTIQGMERFNYNDLISTDDYQEMVNTFRNLNLQFNDSFFRMELGGYRFIGSAQEWIDFLNNASFQQAEESVSDLYNRLSHIDDYINSNFYSQGGRQTQYSYLSSDITTDASASYEERMAVMQAQFQALQAANLMTDQLQNIWIEIRDGNDVNAQQAAEVLQAITSNAQIFNNPDTNFDHLTDQLADLEQQVSNTLDQLDSDVDQTAAGTLADMLRTSEGLQGLSDNLQTVAGQAQRTAEEWLRYDHALEEFFDNYDSWSDVLNNGTLADQAEILPEIQNAYSDLLNLPVEGISESFASNTENLELFRQAAYGSEQAYNQLLAAAQQDIIAHIGIDPSEQVAFQNNLNALQAQMDSLDLQAGAYIDTSSAISAMNDLINSADMTAAQARALLGSMGIDATVESVPIREENSHTFIGADPIVEWESIDVPSMFPYPGGTTTYRLPRITYKPTKTTQVGAAESNATALRVTSASKSSGGNIKFNNTSHGAGSAGRAARAPRGGGGGGGRGSSSKPATPSIQKPSQDKRDPYHDINRLLEKQEQKLKSIQDQDKKLVNRDRLENIKQQNDALETQADLLENKLAIAESQEIRLRNQLLADTNGYANFGANGQITNFNQMLANAEKQYNDYIAYYNTLTKEQQDAAKDQLDLQKERYERVKNTAKEYQDTLDLQRELLEKINEAQEKIYENMIKASQIRVDLAVDTGDLERDWLDFENKFIKKLDKDDFLGNAKANVKELMSYFNSDEIKKRNEEIDTLTKTIARIEKHGGGAYVDPSTGYNLAAAQERLSELLKDQQSALEKIQDIVEDTRKEYLDSLDDAKDKMNDQIDQYERINELIEHNAELAQLMYGDKAYDTLSKYYQLQQKNDERALANLRMQQEYWQSQLNNEVVGSDSWLAIKKHLDDTTDDLNKKLEDMVKRLADIWEQRVISITARMNNALTGGRGLDYLDEQWDYINDYDDNFLDTLESRFGIQQVENLYQQAIDSAAGDPRSQQRINDLMNKQLGILREKDKLTEYDIERAKAALEVEKARMALQDARYSKTKMRLRRDSQGNYTYQYVADEEKLTDLQSALADAQANLYNMDKEHYQQNLNDIYDTYKDYQQKMTDLYKQLNEAQAANDEEESERIRNRIELMRDAYGKLMSGFLEDNVVTLNEYLSNSWADGMEIDKASMDSEQFFDLMRENIPFVQSGIQDLANSITEEGGLIPALQQMENAINNENNIYKQSLDNQLAIAGTTSEQIMEATNGLGQILDTSIQKAESFLPYYDSLITESVSAVEGIRNVLQQVDKVLDKNLAESALVKSARTAYNTLEGLLRYVNPDTGERAKKVTAENINPQGQEIVTTQANSGIISAQDVQDFLDKNQSVSQQITLSNVQALTNLNLEDISKMSDKDILANIINTVKYLTDSMGAMVDQQIGSMIKEASSYIGSISNVEELNQNVHIEASFPNVKQHTEIEQAFNNLVNMASQYAARPKTT